MTNHHSLTANSPSPHTNLHNTTPAALSLPLLPLLPRLAPSRIRPIRASCPAFRADVLDYAIRCDPHTRSRST